MSTDTKRQARTPPRRAAQEGARHRRAAAPGRVPVEHRDLRQVIDDPWATPWWPRPASRRTSPPDGDGKVGVAKAVGKLVAERAKAAGIDRVVFDRGGNRYHGRVRPWPTAPARAGLEF
jgi:hypothetical protein